MKKILLKLFKKFLLPALLKQMASDKYRDYIVAKINKKFDLKGKDEKEEQKILEDLYNTIIIIIQDLLLNI